VNDIMDSTVPTAPDPDGKIEPGPDDLRWAEEMFEEWQRLLSDVRPAAIATATQLPEKDGQ
jgi:hypothetical protein